MVDNLTPELFIRPPVPVRNQTEKPFVYNGLTFYPKWNHNTGFITYCSQLDNLLIEIIGDCLRIKNSWQKYYKGNNYSDYLHSEIIETYYKLENTLGECLEGAIVKSLAYGVVINENPALNYPNWLTYKTVPPAPMYHKGRVYGAKFELTDFTLKGYNKTFEVWKHEKVRIDSNLFRIETEVKYMRHLHRRKEPINIYKLKDLFNFEIMEQLANDLLTKYQNIEKMPPLQLESLSLKDIRTLATMQNKAIRDVLRRNNNKTYKRGKKRFNELLMANNGYYATVEEKVKAKLSDLINN